MRRGPATAHPNPATAHPNPAMARAIPASGRPGAAGGMQAIARRASPGVTPRVTNTATISPSPAAAGLPGANARVTLAGLTAASATITQHQPIAPTPLTVVTPPVTSTPSATSPDPGKTAEPSGASMASEATIASDASAEPTEEAPSARQTVVVDPGSDAMGPDAPKQLGEMSSAKSTEEGALSGAGAVEGERSASAAAPLHMPEPPVGPSPATLKRIEGVKTRIGSTSSAHAKLPAASSQVQDAHQAVNQPNAEVLAKAQKDLIAAVQAAPSPEIEKLCERIREVIANKRPPDKDALVAAEPEGEALNAGNQLNATVAAETNKVQANYAPIEATPPAGAPAQGQVLPPQPAVSETAPVAAQAAVPDAVPAENVSLDKDAAEASKKAEDAGMHTAPANLVTSGPVAEARGAQGELDQAAKEDTAKVIAGQQQALTKAEGDMAALQAQTLAALEASRTGTAKSNESRQTAMVGSEESKRANAAKEAQKTFGDAKTLVAALINKLPTTAMEEWDTAKIVLSAKFKADLAPVQDKVNKRHSGVSGFFVSVWDTATGLPGWAEEGYTKAEKAFGDGVIAKLKEISTKVNAVIAACDVIIVNARTHINKLYDDLPESMRSFADQEKTRFASQLDQLHNEVIATRDNFNKGLVSNASAAVDEVRAEIAELRKKAGGLLGRIVDAVNRFIDDPVKFIIEGLLELLGIPPASFWAVVAKIKKVVRQIADDPMHFANNLLQGLADGFGLFFSNFGTHLLKGFLEWLLGGVQGVQVPKDVSVKSIVTFFLQLMGITWPNIRKILVKLIGAKNVALVEKVYSMVSLLIEKGSEGIFEMIKEKLDPQAIVDQVVQMAVEFMVSAIIKQVAARIIMLFNPAGAILQALEAIYRVLKWIFQNAARIFTLVETVVNGIADILAGNTAAFAAAVEKGLAMLIAPVISFIADYLSLGDLPSIVAEKVKSMRDWILDMIEKALTWLIEKGKALLAAVGIGKKEEKEHEGTPHEQAVKEVASTLAEPSENDPIEYKDLRDKKQSEAAAIVEARNQSLAAEKVKMSVTFAEPSADQKDNDLDFEVEIAPNTAKQPASIKIKGPRAGLHGSLTEEAAGSGLHSHHVPPKGLGKAISTFLTDLAAELRSSEEWKVDPAGKAVADAVDVRAQENMAVSENDLSAILLSEKAHTATGGVHTIEGSGPIRMALATNPRRKRLMLARRKTLTWIANSGLPGAKKVASYLSVSPRGGNWAIFLADVKRSLTDEAVAGEHGIKPSEVTAVDLLLADAKKDGVEADTAAADFLETRVVRATDAVLHRAVKSAYFTEKTMVKEVMDKVGFGSASERASALKSLDGFFRASWQQYRENIVVNYPTDESQ